MFFPIPFDLDAQCAMAGIVESAIHSVYSIVFIKTFLHFIDFPSADQRRQPTPIHRRKESFNENY